MIIWVLWALNPVNTGLTLYMIVISLKMSPQDHRVSWHCCGVQWSSFVLVITRNCTVIKTAFQECLCQIWATLVKDFYGLWNQSWKKKSTKRWKHFLRLVCKFLWPTYSLLQVFTKITELSSISWLIDLHSSSYWARNLSFKWKFQASESECLQTGWFLNLSFSSKFPLQTLTVMLNKTLPTINGWEAWWPSVSMLDSGN